MDTREDDARLFNCQHFGTILLCRAVISGAALIITLAVLMAILLAHRSKAWENLPKRVFLGVNLSTGSFFLSALVGLDYTHQYVRGRYRAVCQGLGYLLHYTGALVVVFYSALVTVHFFYTTLPVLYTVLPRYKLTYRLKVNLKKINLKMKRMGEVLLFLFLIACPAFLNTWEPFMSQVTSYGSYGPWCWFEQPLLANCSNHTEWYNEDALYLVAIPYTGAIFTCFLFMVCMIILWCGFRFKFRYSAIASDITKVTLTLILLLFITVLGTALFVVSIVVIVNSKLTHERQSKSHWITDAVVNVIVAAALLVIAAFFEHFRVLLCAHWCTKMDKRRRKPNMKQVQFNHEERKPEPSHPTTVMYDQNASSSAYYTAGETFADNADQERMALLSNVSNKSNITPRYSATDAV